MSKELTPQEQKALAVPTSVKSWMTCSPREVKRHLVKVNTTALALASDTPSLSTMRRTLGEKKVEAYMKLWLLDLNMMLDLKSPLKEAQIDEIAFRLVSQYGSLNVADVNLVLGRVLSGENGQVYDRVSIPTVMKWFKDYFEERCVTAANKSLDAHAQHKSAFASTRNDDNGREAHRAAMQQGAAAKRIDEVKREMKG